MGPIDQLSVILPAVSDLVDRQDVRSRIEAVMPAALRRSGSPRK